MLLDRVAAVRSDLPARAARLELEHSPDRDPDPSAVETLWRLLTDGCESPLYNRDIHVSELAAALCYTRRRLSPDDDVRSPSARGSPQSRATAHGPAASDKPAAPCAVAIGTRGAICDRR